MWHYATLLALSMLSSCHTGLVAVCWLWDAQAYCAWASGEFMGYVQLPEV